jgi:hypothetical protein
VLGRGLVGLGLFGHGSIVSRMGSCWQSLCERDHKFTEFCSLREWFEELVPKVYCACGSQQDNLF